MRALVAASPTLSCSSADEALYELLGIDKLSLDQEVDGDDTSDEQTAPVPPPAASHLTPPASCHRPNTPHEALLLVCSTALSPGQCQHIIKKGYQATNDGGAHYGPRYVTQAALETQQQEDSSNTSLVTLAKPNHHKVVVFMDAMISTWLERVIQQYFDGFIQEWNDDNTRYIINPRLRLLRYDAVDEDVFISHYDATTTTIRKGIEYESKLTILVYLNHEFEGGETAFLNSFNPKDFLNISPATGEVVVFNHELYHASRELQVNHGYVVDGVRGGTKFVLRSDVLFEREPVATDESDSCIVADTNPISTCLRKIPTSDAEQVRVVDIVRRMNDTQQLQEILKELDCLHGSVNSFLVPGRRILTRMLEDLGLEQEICEIFLSKCEASLQ